MNEYDPPELVPYDNPNPANAAIAVKQLQHRLAPVADIVEGNTDDLNEAYCLHPAFNFESGVYQSPHSALVYAAATTLERIAEYIGIDNIHDRRLPPMTSENWSMIARLAVNDCLDTIRSLVVAVSKIDHEANKSALELAALLEVIYESACAERRTFTDLRSLVGRKVQSVCAMEGSTEHVGTINVILEDRSFVIDLGSEQLQIAETEFYDRFRLVGDNVTPLIRPQHVELYWWALRNLSGVEQRTVTTLLETNLDRPSLSLTAIATRVDWSSQNPEDGLRYTAKRVNPKLIENGFFFKIHQSEGEAVLDEIIPG